jgi:hypothetical protein
MSELIELELFNPEECVSSRGVPNAPRVNVHKSGRITINKPAVEKLKLNAGSKVAIGMSRDNEFYLLNVGPAGLGFNYVVNEKSGAAVIQNVALVKKMRDILDPNYKETSLNFLLGAEIKAKTNQHGEHKTGTGGFCLLQKTKA